MDGLIVDETLILGQGSAESRHSMPLTHGHTKLQKESWYFMSITHSRGQCNAKDLIHQASHALDISREEVRTSGY